jgi:hypothetical protein
MKEKEKNVSDQLETMAVAPTGVKKCVFKAADARHSSFFAWNTVSVVVW